MISIAETVSNSVNSMIRPRTRYWVFAFVLALATAAPASVIAPLPAQDAPADQGAAAKQSAKPAPPLLDKPLVAESLRSQLRKQTSSLAALGSWHEIDEYVHMLFLIGDTPEDHQPLRPDWSKRVQNADPLKGGRKSKQMVKSLHKSVAALERELGRAPADHQKRLATAILILDSDSQKANVALGNVKVDGRWLSEKQSTWQRGAEHVAGVMGEAWKLEIVVNHAAANHAAARKLYGRDARTVEAFGLRLHGGMAAEKMERILRESLRAMAFSNVIQGGPFEVPTLSPPRELFLTHERGRFDEVLAEAVEAGGLSERQAGEVRRLDLQSFNDGRGWRTSNWLSEADYQALILWDTYEQWLAADVQPCFLAGHLNWLCLNFFGTSMAEVMWRPRSRAQNATGGAAKQVEDVLWKCVGNSFFGCRSWMKQRMKLGEVFPFSHAIVPELGQVRDESLLKATLVNDYLQQTGELGKLIKASANKPRKTSTISKALGHSLAEFEQEWADWMMAEAPNGGIIQRLSAAANDDAATAAANGEGGGNHSKESFIALAKVREIRQQAYVHLNVWVEEVSLNAELSHNAELHAKYLDWNPSQARKWPDAHEEYYGRKGFSPQGAWAGRQSLIHSISDPSAAIDSWMATFYHRLPLLYPGMFGIGFGAGKSFVVLDTNSLTAPYKGELWAVWPADGAKDIGRRFQPEKPNPIPGENQSKWGYPITLQAFFGGRRGSWPIEMTLHLGKERTGKEVPCHFITPESNHNPRFSPENAYALIPKSALKAKQEYTVVATCEEIGKEFIWTFETGK